MNSSPNTSHISNFKGILALSPIVVFLLFYLVVSLWMDDFYAMPISVALLIASAWAVLMMRRTSISRRVEIFSSEAGSSNVMYMIWIFILAGAFASLAKATGSVESTVNLTLQYLPHRLIVPGLFFAACFISMSIGTSVGTVVALTPLAVEMARADAINVPFLVAVVLGGAFFGDNLSFISDTTIAATRTQGCSMKDKFRANILIVFPAAIITLILYAVLGSTLPERIVTGNTNPWLILPYLVIIATAIAGINVTIVLALGIVTAFIQGLLMGYGCIDLYGFMGNGIVSMGELIIVTLLAAGMLGLIKAAGGVEYLIQKLTRYIKGTRGGQAGIALLVGMVNLCTANNTVAIITVGELAKKISDHYHIDPKKSASLLDTASCIVQCLIPYGAQTLMATGLASISPAEPWPYLYYPWALIVTTIISILIKRKRKNENLHNHQDDKGTENIEVTSEQG